MPPEPSQPPAPTQLIVGCGYLGGFLAPRLLDRSAVVYGTTRRQQRLPDLARVGVRAMLVSVTQPLTLASLRPALERGPLDVVYLVPPGRPGGTPTPRQVVIGGIAHMVKQLRGRDVRRAVLVSSSAVYGPRPGEPIDADTPPEPDDPCGQLLLEGEGLWRAAGPSYHVVRLAGLYGPERIIGRRALEQHAPLVGDPRGLLNLIRVEDAAALLEAVLTAEAPGPVELGCDGHPAPRIDYYHALAARLGVPAPEVVGEDDAVARLGLSRRRLRGGSKALDPTPTIRRTGWRPRFADYRAGLDDLLGPPASPLTPSQPIQENRP